MNAQQSSLPTVGARFRPGAEEWDNEIWTAEDDAAAFYRDTLPAPARD